MFTSTHHHCSRAVTATVYCKYTGGANYSMGEACSNVLCLCAHPSLHTTLHFACAPHVLILIIQNALRAKTGASDKGARTNGLGTSKVDCAR